ncbi:unannotated protein [freshwater metagenome]|uniref:Unannotated protein n=1 Tax=freshwater metagenome TaxID=449393 RepID=A0A6J7DQS1_9ZZZZ|nr:hypothetical protein [Actinomycetota bacterium]
MPKRNRTKEQRKQYGSSPVAQPPAAGAATGAVAVVPTPVVRPVDDEVTRAAKMFSESLRAHEAADQAKRDEARAETELMLQHETLRANKQRAADLIKYLRGQSGSRGRMIEAEAAYRLALAELQQFETGERPHWAPAPVVEPADSGADSSTDFEIDAGESAVDEGDSASSPE